MGFLLPGPRLLTIMRPSACPHDINIILQDVLVISRIDDINEASIFYQEKLIKLQDHYYEAYLLHIKGNVNEAVDISVDVP